MGDPIRGLAKSLGLEKRKRTLGPTTTRVEKLFDFELGGEMAALCDLLRTHDIAGSETWVRPMPLSLSATLSVHEDVRPAYLEGFFAASTPFAQLYHDRVYLMAWEETASAHQPVFEWDWEEGFMHRHEPSLDAFLAKRVGEQPERVVGKLPPHGDPARLSERAKWLTWAFTGRHHGEPWGFLDTAAKRTRYAKEREHVPLWPNLAGYWLWHALFFDDDERLDEVLELTEGSIHPFVAESIDLIADWRSGRTRALEALVDVEARREALHAHAPEGHFTAKARRAHAESVKADAAAGRRADAKLTTLAKSDTVLGVLDELSKDFDFQWARMFDYLQARDAEELAGEPHLPIHFEALNTLPDDYDRMMFLRDAVTRDHREPLIALLARDAKAKKPRGRVGLVVELLARTCRTYPDMLGAMRAALGKKPPKAVEANVTYAARLFATTREARKRLVRAADAYVDTIRDSPMAPAHGYDALYALDTPETATLLNRLVVGYEMYTYGDWPWRKVVAALKRARSLKHAKRCVKGLRAVVEASYHDYGRQEAVMSLLHLEGEKIRPILFEGFEAWRNVDTKRTSFLAGLLWLEPKSKRWIDEARKAIRRSTKERDGVDMSVVAALRGLLMAIEQKDVRALHPSVATVAKWNATGSAYGTHRMHVDVAIALAKRRAANILER